MIKRAQDCEPISKQEGCAQKIKTTVITKTKKEKTRRTHQSYHNMGPTQISSQDTESEKKIRAWDQGRKSKSISVDIWVWEEEKKEQWSEKINVPEISMRDDGLVWFVSVCVRERGRER